jgi:hypothetical protein
MYLSMPYHSDTEDSSFLNYYAVLMVKSTDNVEDQVPSSSCLSSPSLSQRTTMVDNGTAAGRH